MIEILNLSNIKLVSINNKYNLDKRRGKLFLSPAYRDFKKLIYFNCAGVVIDPPYRVSIIFKGYIDIDNPVKPILDALQKRGIIDDDKNVLELNIVKVPGLKNKPGALSVSVEQM